MGTVNEYLKETYGCKVYKLALQARVTCPNRDGTLGTRGCIFCSEGGSGDFAADVEKPILSQIEDAKRLVAGKISGQAKYIAYFQSFTNTYGDPAYLSRIFHEAIEPDDIVILSIGTRPDCISEEMYQILSELNQIKPVWVELGLQTIHPQSAAYIRRGYDLPVYDECVKRLRAEKIAVITHVILGLPGEDIGKMKETVRYVVASGVQGIKLQLLHVLRGTDLEKEYEAGKVLVLEMEEYLSILKEVLDLIPEDVILHRLTGDGPKKKLIAPAWSADKKRVLNEINRLLRCRDTARRRREGDSTGCDTVLETRSEVFADCPKG